eukprot:gene8889-13779_t
MRTVAVALAVSAAFGLVAAQDAARTCTSGAFNEAEDYFAQKTAGTGSALFSVSYGLVYKNVTVDINGVKSLYQLVQCFTDPDAAANATAFIPVCETTADVPCSRFEIPLQKVSVGGALFLSMLEEIEVEKTVKYTELASVSPCVQSNNPGAASTTDTAQLNEIDAFFTDTTPLVTDAGYTKFVRTGLTHEQEPMARAWWVEFASLFYNQESLANYMIERVKITYDLQSENTWDELNVVWIDSIDEAAGEATMLGDVYFRNILSDAKLTITDFSQTVTFDQLDAALRTASAVVIGGAHLDLTAALEKLSVENVTEYLFYDNGTARVYQTDRHKSSTQGLTAAYFDAYTAAAPDLVLSDAIKATRKLAPWSSPSKDGGVDLMFLRRVDELPIEVSADAETCGMGVSRPTDPHSIRHVLTSSLVEKVSENPTGAVAYERLTDYFPDKFETRYAALFTVSYHLTWKMVRSLSTGEQYVLVQRGTEAVAPSAYVGTRRFTIPIETSAYQATPEVGIAALLGVLGHVKITTVTPSECVLKGIEEGDMVSSWSISCADAGALDVMFGAAGCDNSAYSSATADPGPLNRLEWVGYIALFHNKEARASTVVDTVAAKYLCIRERGMAAAALSGKRPNVALVRGIYKPATPGPDFKEGYLANKAEHERITFHDAGGNNLAFDDASSIVTEASKFEGGTYLYHGDAVFRRALADVDVLFDNSYVSGLYPNLTEALAFYNLTVDDTQFKFIANRQMYRLDRRINTPAQYTDQFVRFVIEPDAVLQDFISVFHPDAVNTTSTFFVRNLFEGDEKFEIEAGNCANIDAEVEFLTEEHPICFLPCAERQSREYCTTSCYWWTDSSCRESPQE